MNDTDIIRLRQEGISCHVVAARLGISTYEVKQCMSRNGLTGRFRARGPWQGSTKPIVEETPERGAHHDEQRTTALQQLVHDIDALYMRHVLRGDTWPDLQDVARLIVRAAEKAEANDK